MTKEEKCNDDFKQQPSFIREHQLPFTEGWMAGYDKSQSEFKNLGIADVVDSLEFIADSLSEEALLRQMIDDWCIKQLGNTDEALEVADKMFTAARDIFCNVS